MALDFLRRHQQRKSLFLVIPLVLILLSFIAFYFPQATPAGSRGEQIGSVGDVPITLGEFQRAYLSRRRFYEQAYRGQIDERMLKAMGLESQVFEGLVGEKLMELEARRLGIAVNDAAVARAIATDPTLQRDGKFIGREELKRLLSLQGISTEEFTEQQRQRLVLDRLRAIVSAGVAVSPAEAEEEFRRRSEQVKAEYVLVSAEPFRSTATVSEADVRARFGHARTSTRYPRSASSRPSSWIRMHSVPRSRSPKRHQSLLPGQQRRLRRARRGLRQPHPRTRRAEGGTEGHADADAKKIADDLLAKLQAGAEFTALAKKSSEDKGSAANGGDLGCFPQGRMLPEFDAAAFALPPGETRRS